MRVFIAEDDMATRALLTMLLRKQGFTPESASDGAEAWEVLQLEDAPQLVLLDRQMPGMDGLEVCQRMRALKREPRPYVSMVTAVRETEALVEGLEAGADDYITKPFDHAELQARVRVGERMLALQRQLIKRAEELQRATDEIHALQDLVPICCHCKRVRDDQNFWQEVEQYVHDRTGAEFSHGVCPSCYAKHYPG